MIQSTTSNCPSLALSIFTFKFTFSIVLKYFSSGNGSTVFYCMYEEKRETNVIKISEKLFSGLHLSLTRL